jgi:signal peptidase II
VSKIANLIWLRWTIFGLIALGGTTIDLWTKQRVFAWRGVPSPFGPSKEPWWLIENYVGIETAVNLGALFGMGAGFGSVFAILSVIAGLAILIWLSKFRAIESWWLLVALACVMGGIGGNLYDRLGMWYQTGYPPEWKSGVRDWILLRYEQFTWPNFNIADSLLVCGAIMLAVHSFMIPPQQSTCSKPETTA